MAKKDEVKIEEDTLKTEPKSTKGKSEAYKNLEEIIEAYKKSNPSKYELKKEALAKELAALA